MDLMEYILAVIGMIAALFAIGYALIRVSVYYQKRFSMSVWPGIFMLVISVVLAAYAFIHFTKPNVFLLSISIFVLGITAYLDIRHAGTGMGMVAVLFQLIMAALFMLVVLFFLLRLALNLTANRKGKQAIAIVGGAEAVKLFFEFFVP